MNAIHLNSLPDQDLTPTQRVTIALKRASLRAKHARIYRNNPDEFLRSTDAAVQIIQNALAEFPEEPVLHLRLADLATMHPGISTAYKLGIVHSATEKLCQNACNNNHYQIGAGFESSMFANISGFAAKHGRLNTAIYILLVAKAYIPWAPMIDQEYERKLLQQYASNPAQPDKRRIQASVLPPAIYG